MSSTLKRPLHLQENDNAVYLHISQAFHYKYISKTVQTSYHNLLHSSVLLVSLAQSLAMVGRQWQLIIANDTPVGNKLTANITLYFYSSYCSKLVHQLFCHFVVQCVTTFRNLGPSPPLLHFCFAWPRKICDKSAEITLNSW